MGWGISIPSLGINTGEIIGGDIGKGLSTVSKELKRDPVGGTFKAGLKVFDPLGLWKEPGSMQPAQDFSDLTSKWDQVSNSFVQQGAPAAIAANQQASMMGQQNALANLGQFGGQAMGAQDRLARQSKWGQANTSADIMQNARLAENQTKMQGILGLDLPIQMGKEQAAAQARAAGLQNSASGLGLLGTIGGAAVGGFFGGPMGAAAGSSVGGALGQNLGRSRYG